MRNLFQDWLNSFRRGTVRTQRFSRRRSLPAIPSVVQQAESRVLLSGAALEVKDINTSVSSSGSNPNQFTVVGNTSFFVATDSAGTELWKTDGTPAGTSLVKDINPGSFFEYSGSHIVPNSSNPAFLTNLNGTLYFTANDGKNGTALWKSDGTAAGTMLLKKVAASNLTNINGSLFFTVEDSVNGSELWKSNGTLAGTVLVKDLGPGNGSSFPRNLTGVNQTLFFTAYDGPNGIALWKSNGTAAGTILLKDIDPDIFGTSPSSFTNVNGKLFFTSDDGTHGFELWESDGTVAGTILVKDINPGSGNSYPLSLASMSGTLYFAIGAEVWKSDGSASGTVPVKNIHSSSGSSVPRYLTNVNGTLYFTGIHFSAGRYTHLDEVWKSDGTTAGTVMVKQVGGGSVPFYPSNLTNINNTLYFTANDGTSGYELWKSNGTAAGTVLVKDIVAGSGGSSPGNLTNLNGIVCFTANDGNHGAEVWRSNGTAVGTSLVNVISTGTNDSNPSNLTNVNGTLYFTADDGTHGVELWKRTTAGVMLVQDIRPGSGSSSPGNLANLNGVLYFTANDGVHGSELWKSDGTAVGTISVKDVLAGSGGSSPANLTNISGTLYFTANDGLHGFELWKSNGTGSGTVLVNDIRAGSSGSSPGNLINLNGLVYFTANDGLHGIELWKSDGTAVGTVLVKDVLAGSGGSSPTNLTNVSGTLYFAANDGLHGFELWNSNGTGSGTVLIKDIAPSSGSSFPGNLTNLNGKIFFTANDGVSGIELWKSDGSVAGTVLVKDIAPGSSVSYYGDFTFPNSSSPGELTNLNGTLYFSATLDQYGRELWKSDGTAAGTALVKDIFPGYNSDGGYYGGNTNNANPMFLTNVNGSLLFKADDGTNGPGLWRTDGTTAGTILVQTLDPSNLTNVNGAVYFQANNGLHGKELWTFSPPVLTGSGTSSYREKQPKSAINTVLTVGGTNSTTLASASVKLTNYISGQDVLEFVANPATMGNIIGKFDSNKGVLTLTSPGSLATLGQFQAALRAVTYFNTNANPTTTLRSVVYQVSDGILTSNSIATSVSIIPVNDAPVLSGMSSQTYTELQDPIAVHTSLVVVDVDSITLASASVTPQKYVAGQDVLNFTSVPTITGNIFASFGTSTGTMTLRSPGSTATLAQFQAAIRSVTYANTSDNPSTKNRSVTFQVSDGELVSNVVASTITVTAINNAPELVGMATLNYKEKQVATAINPTLKVSDVDNSTLASATVRLTNYVAGQDILNFSNNSASMGNIVAKFDTYAGELTLSSSNSTATVLQFQAALRSVTYANTSSNPAIISRSVVYQIFDGRLFSQTLFCSINVTTVDNAPVLTGSSTITYSKNQGPTFINPLITVSDIDNTKLSFATIKLTNYVSSQDELGFVPNTMKMGNITGSFNAITRILTLTSVGNSSSVSQFQAALRAVSYRNKNATPIPTPRIVEYRISDGTISSSSLTSKITFS